MAGINYYDNQITNPVWAADYLSRDHLIPGPFELLPSAFPNADSIAVVVGANAAADATSVTVAALSGPLKSGTTVSFGAKKFVLLTADAAKGATALTVSALPTALVAGDTGYFQRTSAKRIEGGFLVGRTYAERETGTPLGPWASGDDEVFLTAFDVPDADNDPSCTVVRPGTVIKENFLPGWANYTTNQKAALRAAYRTQKGTP